MQTTRRPLSEYREPLSLTVCGYLAMFFFNTLFLAGLVAVIGVGANLLLWVVGLQ